MWSATWGLVRAGFRHQLAFRFALVSGIVTNCFFGLVRTGVFLAVYRSQDQVAELDLADTLTYVWVLQAVFAVLWAPWMQELPGRIRSGEWTAELLRPGHHLVRQYAYDAGRTLAVLALRAPVPLLIASVAFDLRMPTTPARCGLFVGSIVLAAAVAVTLRSLYGALAFWTPDYRGIFSLAFGPIYLLAGFVVPIEFFPDVLARIAAVSPLAALLTAPVAVATGRAGPEALLLQTVWLAVLVAVCDVVYRRALSRVVAFGG